MRIVLVLGEGPLPGLWSATFSVLSSHGERTRLPHQFLEGHKSHHKGPTLLT